MVIGPISDVTFAICTIPRRKALCNTCRKGFVNPLAQTLMGCDRATVLLANVRNHEDRSHENAVAAKETSAVVKYSYGSTFTSSSYIFWCPPLMGPFPPDEHLSTSPRIRLPPTNPL